jgi:hypothetical protein
MAIKSNRLIMDDSDLEMLCQKVKFSVDKNGHRICELVFVTQMDNEITAVLPDWMSRQFVDMRKPGGPSTSSWKDREIYGQIVNLYAASKPHTKQLELQNVTITGIYLERDAKTAAIHLFFSVKVICGKELWDWCWSALGGFTRASVVPAQGDLEIPMPGKQRTLTIPKTKNRKPN